MKDVSWKIRALDLHHIQEVLEIHLASFPGFFLSFLGRRFLREFYSAFLHEESGVALIVEEPGSNQVLGCVVGTTLPTGFFKRLLKRRWWAFSFASISALMRKPKVAPRIFRALFYRGEVPQGPKRALLSSIAVRPDQQGTGLGRALVAGWVEEARKRGAPGCYLTTDAENNYAVNRFYVRCGWRLESTYFTPEGRRMNRYVLDFG
jgi:ribosomal protein S18 acetylase RimI-like enzyme